MPTRADLQREVSTLRKDVRSYKKNSDGWANLLTGMGVVGYDKKMSTNFVASKIFNEAELNDLYRSDGFGKRVVNIVAAEMVREWFKVANDTDNKIVEYLNDLKAKTKIDRMLKWDRLHGGALAILLISDGQENLAEPLNENNMSAIEDIRIYDRWAVNWSTADLYQEPTHKKYATPERFTVNPRIGGLGSFQVHESRTLFFDGMDLPDISRAANGGWGDSVFQAIYTQLRGLGNVYSSVETILDDFVQAVMSIKNLQALVAAGKEDIIKKRLQILDMSKHMLNTMLIDTEETYEKKASTVAGLEKVMGKFASALSSVSGIPVTLLTGESAKGLNAGGSQAADIRNFYDMVKAEQESKLKPALERLVFIVQKLKDGPTKGKEIDGWAIEFNPLWQPTERETADTRKIVAETDQIYDNMGAVTPEEVRESRFGGESYSLDMAIDPSNPPDNSDPVPPLIPPTPPNPNNPPPPPPEPEEDE